MKHTLRILLALIALYSLSSSIAHSDGGVLKPFLPGSEVKKDVLDLARMEVRVEIDNGMAQVAILQIYRSQYHRALEGQYEFMIPETAELSQFAIWEDGVRIPGVIMERRRAREIYEELRAQRVDPGLMEESDDDQVNRFSCRVFPIPAYGTKRIELSYTQVLPIESEKLYFFFPSKPTLHETQQVGSFSFSLDFESDAPFGDPVFLGDAPRLTPTDRTPNGFTAAYQAENVALSQNIELEIPVPTDAAAIHFLAYRDTDRVWRNISPAGGENFRDEYGFFSARAVFPREKPGQKQKPKQLVIALDTSLSMQWDKLDRALAIAMHLLSDLSPDDRFGVVAFNEKPTALADSVQPAGPDARQKADQWIRGLSLSGGTDFSTLFDAMGEQFSDDGRLRAVLLTDGAPTINQIDANRILEGFKKSRLAKTDMRLYVVGIGDDANRTFLNDLAVAGGGPYLWIGSTEDSRHKTEVLADRLDAQVLENITFELTGTQVVDAYPNTPGVAFGGGSLDFVGRFAAPGKGRAVLRFETEGVPQTIQGKVAFPEQDTRHEGLRRRWAKARVMELLDRIEREGESKEWIDEIILLSKQFTFVTPYTSFLAAPRALLRPRVIRPGDPILRVRTDPSIREVIASFPFGLTQKLAYLADQDVWQLRFLAPPGWPDGSYQCVLYLTDLDGRRFVETKRFVIDGAPPKIYPRSPGPWHAGRSVELIAAADADTRRLSARIPYAGYCELRYDADRMASVGIVELPDSMPAGTHTIQWFAEDFAHNVTRITSEVEVLPHD